jgi:hypothetical protein
LRNLLGLCLVEATGLLTGAASLPGSIPTLASKSKRLCAKVFPEQGVVMDTKTDTNIAAGANLCQRTPTRP